MTMTISMTALSSCINYLLIGALKQVPLSEPQQDEEILDVKDEVEVVG